MRLTPLFRILFTTTGLFFLTGCSTALLEQRGNYLHSYQAGSLALAEQQVDAIACQTKTDQGFKLSKEASWVLLERATLRFAMGRTNEAVSDYAKALESLDYYSQTIAAEKCAQILTQDEAAAYQADDFEQVLARVYFALALLHKGDEINAFAMLRQAEEFQQEKQNFYAKLPFTKHYRLADNGLSKYLFALLLERKGDSSNANVLYQQASALIPCGNEISCRSSFNGNQATVLVICHNGNAPFKISASSPASIASACALEIFMASQGIDPAWSSLTGIPVPALRTWPGSYPLPTFAELDDVQSPLIPFYDVNQAATAELEKKMPVIAARGVARLLMRRAAVGYFDRQDPCLGMMADLTMLIVNSQTKADTRSWATLPAVIEAARFDLAPGCSNLTLKVFEGGCPDTRTYRLNLKPHDLCIVHIFNIHPGVRKILIPTRYLENGYENK